MNYDPVHDKSVSNDSKVESHEDSGNPEPETQAVGDGGSPTRKAISISSLVSSNSKTGKAADEDAVGGELTGAGGGAGGREGSGEGVSAGADGTELVSKEEEEGENEDGDHHTDKQRKKRKPVTPKGKKTAPQTISKGTRHLKKSDGEPFWRKDIQYDFLQELFNDETRVFTNDFPHCDIPSANNSEKLSFSELYIRTLAESGKCSKILKERLLKDKEMGKSVGKVCLLVNAGRMNTTINFVPEMRSSLRTYHSIPSLQADPVYGGSKPLQDTPRLKSILKAVCDGQDHLKTLDDILYKPSTKKPNTNLIQLIFLWSNYSKGIKYQYEDSPTYNNTNNFMEFFLNYKIHPASRVKRFLWLLYTYLETSFTSTELENNPFNPSVIPPIEFIPDKNLDDFDKDTDYEIEYSEKMYRTRLKYVADEEHNNNPKRGNKSKKEKEAGENDDSFTEDNIEQLADTADPDTVDSKKRPLLADEISRKRKGKRNPAAHNTTVSSPLTKSVITFSLDDANAKEQNDDNYEESKDSHNENGSSTSDDTEKGHDNDSNLQFPIDGLINLIKKFVTDTTLTDEPDFAVSVEMRNNIISKSQQIIRQIRNSTKSGGVDFVERCHVLEKWLFKYFQYKKDTSNGLLGIEYEDIRYDITNICESSFNQQFGKVINNLRMKNLNGAEKSTTNSSSSESIVIENVPFDYFPIHDFNRTNEKNSYAMSLIALCSQFILNNSKEKKEEVIKFDLNNDTISFV